MLTVQVKIQIVVQILIDTLELRYAVRRPLTNKEPDEKTGGFKIVKYTGDIEELSSWHIDLKKFEDEGIYPDEANGILANISSKCGFTYYFPVSFPPSKQKFIVIERPNSTSWAGIIKKLRHELEKILSQEITNTVNKFPYKLPAGTKWENFIIKYLDTSGDRVLIKVSKFPYETNYREMGFEDKRKNKHNSQWAFLCILAKNRGEINWKIPDAHIRLKKCKERLTKQLQDYFGIDYDPFYPYVDTKSYRIKITLIPYEEEAKDRVQKNKINDEISELFDQLQIDDK